MSAVYKTEGWTDAFPLWTDVCPTRLDRHLSTLDTLLSKLICFFNFIPEGVYIFKRYFTAGLTSQFFNFWHFFFLENP